MIRYNLMMRYSIISLLLLLLAPSLAHAVPVRLQLTIDELTNGLFVLSGDLDDTFTPGLTSVHFLTGGPNWDADVILKKISIQISTGPFLDYDIQVRARHRSNPAPHPGETTPGLFLGGGGEVTHFNIKGSNPGFAAPGPQDDLHQLIHPGSKSDYDVLKSHVDDLNGTAAGFLTADNQLSARIALAHTPEPSTLALLGVGLMSLAGLRKKTIPRDMSEP